MPDDRENENRDAPMVLVNQPVSIPMQVRGPSAGELYVVWDHTLAAYETALAVASTASNFGLFAAGTLITVAITLITSGAAMSVPVLALFFSAALVSLLAVVWFVVAYRRAKRTVDEARTKIRNGPKLPPKDLAAG